MEVRRKLEYIASFFAASLLVLSLAVTAHSQESSCIKCHTSTKKLIELTRALAAKKPPQKSTETAGEG